MGGNTSLVPDGLRTPISSLEAFPFRRGGPLRAVSVRDNSSVCLG